MTGRATNATLRRRDQSGSTLVEVILAVGLSALVMVPMLGWTAMSMRQQIDIRDRNIVGTSLGLLRTSFFSDVTSAFAMSTDGNAELACGADRLSDTALLVLEQPERNVSYGIAPGSDRTATLWRLECASNATDPVRSTELVNDVLPGMTTAVCSAGAEADDVDGAPPAAGSGSVGSGHAAHDNAADIAKEKTAGKGRQGDAQGAGEDGIAQTPPTVSCVTVTLRVTDTSYRQGVMTASMRVGSTGERELDPPVATITADPVSGPRALKVQFSSEGSKDAYGEPLEYLWDFGDGTTSTEANPTHTFESVGTTTVRLTVTSTTGLTAAASIDIEVLDNVPVAAIAEPSPGTATTRGTPVVFSSAGSNDDLDAEWGGRIVAHEWDFGDGTRSNDANPTKAYRELSQGDGFVVTLTVTDDAGQQASAQTRVVVANRVPTVTIDATPTSGTSPLQVSFSAVVVDEPDLDPAPPLSYAWELGDGLTSSEATPPAVSYAGPGTRTVTLTVTDDAGATATATTTVTVNALAIGPPTGLRRTNSGNEQGARFIELAWNRVEGADLYEVFLRCESCEETASGSESGTTVRIRGLSPGRKWYLASARARDSATGQWGPWSAEIRVRS